jgi:hypothetical protein
MNVLIACHDKYYYDNHENKSNQFQHPLCIRKYPIVTGEKSYNLYTELDDVKRIFKIERIDYIDIAATTLKEDQYNDWGKLPCKYDYIINLHCPIWINSLGSPIINNVKSKLKPNGIFFIYTLKNKDNLGSLREVFNHSGLNYKFKYYMDVIPFNDSSSQKEFFPFIVNKVGTDINKNINNIILVRFSTSNETINSINKQIHNQPANNNQSANINQPANNNQSANINQPNNNNQSANNNPKNNNPKNNNPKNNHPKYNHPKNNRSRNNNPKNKTLRLNNHPIIIIAISETKKVKKI